MDPINYYCCIAVEARAALERMAREEWIAVEFEAAGARHEHVATSFRCNAIRICGARNYIIRARPVDIAPKVEIVIFHVEIETPRVQSDPRFLKAKFTSFDTMTGPILGLQHQVFVGKRSLQVPGWRQSGVGDISLEDLLVLRGRDRADLIIAPDEQEIGALHVTSKWSEVHFTSSSLLDLSVL